MLKCIKKILSVLIVVLYITNIGAPLSYAVSPSVDVVLPFDELKGLIQDLEDAGMNVVGEAGLQIRQSIRELRAQMELVIDQVKDAAKEVIREAAMQLRSLIEELMDQARALLNEVNDMVSQQIKCINQALAERIAQIKDSIMQILDKLNDTIRDAVNLVYAKAGMLVDKGSYNVKTIMDSTLNIIAKVVILIFIFLMLFWLIRALWKGAFPKVKVLRYGIPSLIVLLVAGGVYLLFSSSALAAILGSDIILPNAENSCQVGDSLYTEFMDLKNREADTSTLTSVGNSALEKLGTCSYATMSSVLAQVSRDKMDDIGAILYPPPPPPPSTPIVSDCEQETGQPSVSIGWVSRYDLMKVGVLEKLTRTNIIRADIINPVVRDTSTYFRTIRRIGIKPRVIIRSGGP